MPGQITAFDIGECMVKAACFTGGKLKKVMAKELPDNMVSGGEIVSMDAMADFIKEMAKENGHLPRCGGGHSARHAGVHPQRDCARHDGRPTVV